MLDAQSINARATFHTRQNDEWEASIEDVGVLYEPQGSAYVNESTGDKVHRDERILAPLGVDQHIVEGDRVTLQYRDTVYKWRIENMMGRSIDGVEGFCQLELADYGDDLDDSDDEGDNDWDLG